MMHLNRRSFLKTTAALAAVGVLNVTGAAGAEGTPNKKPFVRLGGPISVKSDDPEQLALAYRALGYRAGFCPKIPITETDRIKATAAAFAKHDVILAEVGRWVNLLDADPAKRKANIELVTDGLALAEAAGARCCVDTAGSFNKEVWYGPDPRNFSKEFFDAIVENARKIIDAVKPTRARFAYEMMGWALPDTADNYMKLLQAIDRKGFGVHLDPCNAINSPEKFYDNTALLNECFDKMGPHIVSCHAKDLAWEVEMNVHFTEVRPGTGCLDYTTYLKRLAQLPGEVPLMLEHMKGAEEYAAAKKYIMEVGAKAGIGF